MDFPMKIKFGIRPKTLFYDSETDIKVKTIMHPPENYKEICYKMLMSTWADYSSSNDRDTVEAENKAFMQILKFEVLPNSLESLVFTFCIEGLTLVEVTHLLRHRTFFGIHAQCTADRFLQEDSVFIPTSIKNSKFKDEYIELTKKAAQLYTAMVDSKEISLLDARYILPRNNRYFYYVSMNLKDAMNFINQRKCTAIQPELDNILAKRIYEEISKYIPEIKKVVSLKCNSNCHAIKGPIDKTSRIYQPDKNHAEFVTDSIGAEYFIYNKTRKQMGINYEVE